VLFRFISEEAAERGEIGVDLSTRGLKSRGTRCRGQDVPADRRLGGAHAAVRAFEPLDHVYEC